ncbi:MAG: hypothetical protein ABFS38_19930 [Bacteroidota bacterium]
MKKSTLLLLIALFGLISCGTLSEGIVIEKRYTPELYYGVYGPPYDEYLLLVEGEMNSKMVTEKIYVSKSCYDSIEIGDLYKIEY